jgi:thiosulfate/3-mercaptopyruvate sulfurtransferase
MEPVVEAAWVAAHLDDVVVADVRWYLDGRSGPDAYAAGHIPGAVFVEMDGCLAAPPSPSAGRHPLPDPIDFARCMSRLGIGDGQAVVAYDDARGSAAARLVWMLRALGEQAALLDGGLAAWEGPVEQGPGPPREPARFTPRPWPADRIVTIDEVAASRSPLVDARAPERYRGESEPVDPRAGHIPGALNLPWTGNVDPETGRFLTPDELRARYAEVASGSIVYCGSGINACHDLLAMERAGISGVRLYPGSWSQWSADPSRPAASGPDR